MSGINKQALIDAINQKSKQEIVEDLANGIIAIDELTSNFMDDKGGLNMGKIATLTMKLTVNPKGAGKELGVDELTNILNKYSAVNNG